MVGVFLICMKNGLIRIKITQAKMNSQFKNLIDGLKVGNAFILPLPLIFYFSIILTSSSPAGLAPGLTYNVKLGSDPVIYSVLQSLQKGSM